MASSIPGPSGYSVFDRSFRGSPLDALWGKWREFGDLFKLTPVPGYELIFAVHPEMVEHILMEHGDSYLKEKQVYNVLALLLGRGILVCEGDRWRRQRRLMQPAFHRESLSRLAGVMTRRAQERVDAWLKKEDGSVVEVPEEMQSLTLEIVSEALFGSDIETDADGFAKAFRTCAEFVDHRINSPIRLPLSVPTSRNRGFLKSRAHLNRVANQLIQNRRLDKSPRYDLLAMLIAATDTEGGGQLNDEELRDEVITLMIAGHETVSVTLTWALHLLGKHREIFERLAHETDQAIGSRAPEPSDYPALTYARMVIQESMRMYPPVWGLVRETIQECEMGGHKIRKGQVIMPITFFTHRHEEFWPEPEKFDPDRFTEVASAKRHRFAYWPFSGGPRVCIGNQFAMVEAVLVLTTLIQRFRLEHVSDKPVEIDPTFTIRPKGGLPMRLVRR